LPRTSPNSRTGSAAAASCTPAWVRQKRMHLHQSAHGTGRQHSPRNRSAQDSASCFTVRSSAVRGHWRSHRSRSVSAVGFRPTLSSQSAYRVRCPRRFFAALCVTRRSTALTSRHTAPASVGLQPHDRLTAA
jgi:hypothetical protein